MLMLSKTMDVFGGNVTMTLAEGRGAVIRVIEALLWASEKAAWRIVTRPACGMDSKSTLKLFLCCLFHLTRRIQMMRADRSPRSCCIGVMQKRE